MSISFLLLVGIELAVPVPPQSSFLPASPRRDAFLEKLEQRPTKETRHGALIQDLDHAFVSLFAKFDQMDREFANSLIRLEGTIRRWENRIADLRAVGDIREAKRCEGVPITLRELRAALIETTSPEQQIESDLAALAKRTTFREEYLSQAARKASAARSCGNEAEALRHERLAQQYKVIDARYLNKIFAIVNRDVALCNALLKASEDGEPRVNKKHCEELSRKLEEALGDLKQQATHSVEYQDWMLKLTLSRTLRMSMRH